MGDFIGAVFWSLIISSLIISIMGILKRKPVWLIISAILAVPLSLYLNMFPLFRYIGLLLPLFQLGASIVYKKNCMVKLFTSITNCWNYMLVGDSCTYTIKHGIRGSCFDKNNTEGNT